MHRDQDDEVIAMTGSMVGLQLIGWLALSLANPSLPAFAVFATFCSNTNRPPSLRDPPGGRRRVGFQKSSSSFVLVLECAGIEDENDDEHENENEDDGSLLKPPVPSAR